MESINVLTCKLFCYEKAQFLLSVNNRTFLGLSPRVILRHFVVPFCLTLFYSDTSPENQRNTFKFLLIS